MRTVIPLLSTAFGVVAGVAIDQVLPMAAVGLAWGLLLAAVAPRVARWGAARTAWPDWALSIAVALAFTVLGGALLGGFLATSPAEQVELFAHASFGSFFYAIHGLFEWVLMPALLMLNWHHPTRRRLLVAAAITFYAGRLSSALYFAPHAMDWGEAPATADLGQVRVWMSLNWVRVVLQDTATAVLLLVAARRPADAG